MNLEELFPLVLVGCAALALEAAAQTTVTKIAAVGDFSLFVKSDGSLWSMGYNAYGQLGDGTVSNRNRPQQIVASNVTDVAAGSFHSLFLKSDGSLWGMGDDSEGELGDGTTSFNPVTTPEQIAPGGITAMAAAGYYSLFLKSDGSLWGMGRNLYGQLGDGFLDPGFVGPTVPEQIFPPPQPVLIQTVVPPNHLQFAATCQFGGKFVLLTSTNASRQLDQWTPVLTNVITSRQTNVFFNTIIRATNSGIRQFYILKSQ